MPATLRTAFLRSRHATWPAAALAAASLAESPTVVWRFTEALQTAMPRRADSPRWGSLKLLIPPKTKATGLLSQVEGGFGIGGPSISGLYEFPL
jgi:hypothetical protein